MADPVTPAASPASSPAPAPAPSTSPSGTPPAPVAPVAHGTPPDEASPFERTFGVRARPQWTEEPSEPVAPASEAAPAEAGHAPAEDAPESSSPTAQGETPPQAPPKVGDDVLAEFSKLAIGKPADAPPVELNPVAEPLPADEAAFEKRINPDGQATVEQQLQNARKLAKEAQSSIGRQSQIVHQARTLTKGLEPYFKFNPQGQLVDVDVVALTNSIPKERVDAQLKAAGFKVVPLDWQPSSPQDGEDADIVAAVNAMHPSDSLTFEEKLAEIQSDVRQMTKLTGLVAERKADSRVQRQTEAAQRHVRTQAEIARIDQETQSFFGDLKKKPHYATELKPAIDYWNNLIPDQGPGALVGKQRLEVLHRLAEFNRVPKVMETVRDQAFEAGRQSVLEQMGLTGVDGEVPTYVATGSGQRSTASARRGNEQITPADEEARFRKAYL